MTVRCLFASLALLAAASAAPGQTFFFNNPGAIPDGGSSPGTFGPPRIMATTSNVANPIQDVAVTITMSHTYIGDLRIVLSYVPTGSAETTNTAVLSRVGALNGASAGDSSNLNGTYTFLRGGTSMLAAAGLLDTSGVVPTGAYAPVESNLDGSHSVVEFADALRGLSGTGAWTLTFRDGEQLAVGTLTSASITLQARPLPCLSDFNTDGVVNTADLTFFLGRFGQACP